MGGGRRPCSERPRGGRVGHGRLRGPIGDRSGGGAAARRAEDAAGYPAAAGAGCGGVSVHDPAPLRGAGQVHPGRGRGAVPRTLDPAGRPTGRGCRRPGTRGPLRRRHRGHDHAHAQDARRPGEDPGAGGVARHGEGIHPPRPVLRGQNRGGGGAGRGGAGAGGGGPRPFGEGAGPERGEPRQGGLPRRAGDHQQSRASGAPGRSGGEQSRAQGGAGAADPGDLRPDGAPQAPGRPPRQGDRGAGDAAQDPVPSARGNGQDAPGVLPPGATQGDPEGAGGDGRARSGDPGAGAEDHQGEDAHRGRSGGEDPARTPVPHASGCGRGLGHPHLPGLADRSALGEADQGQSQHQAGAEDPRGGPLRPGKSQGADPGVPGSSHAEAEAQERDEGPHSVLRRPTGCWEDLAGAVHRALPGTEVRPHLPGRRPGRGGDPGAPADLHRRPARQDHPGDQAGRDQQPGLHDGRGGQGGRRLPGRPVGRPAGGAGSGAELGVHGSLPGGALRPAERDVHHHGESCRPHHSRAEGPHGGYRDLGVHRGGEAAHRPPLRPAAAIGGERHHPEAVGVAGRGHPQDRTALHAGGGTPESGAGDRHGVPEGGAGCGGRERRA